MDGILLILIIIITAIVYSCMSRRTNTNTNTNTPGTMCCKALTAECLACSEGMSVNDYCRENPNANGCRRPDQVDEGRLGATGNIQQPARSGHSRYRWRATEINVPSLYLWAPS